jgi:hypothetical protein
MSTAILAFSLLLSSAPTQGGAAPAPQLVRVFVYTDDTGDAAELAGRRDSVKDLREALAGKKKTVTVVSDQTGADVVVEVTDRSVTIPKVVIGVGPVAGPGTPPHPARAAHLKVKARYGKDAELPFTNKNSPIESSGGWKGAAEDIAKQMEKWITSHRAELLAGRGGLAISAPVH